MGIVKNLGLYATCFHVHEIIEGNPEEAVREIRNHNFE